MVNLADLGALHIYTGQDASAAIDAGQQRRTLQDLGEKAAQGDYAGAEATAWRGGQPDIAAHLATMSTQQHAQLVDDAGRFALGATTPELWAAGKAQFEQAHPGFVVPPFQMRGQLVSAAQSISDQIAQRQKEEEIGIERQKAAQGPKPPPGYQWNADHSGLAAIPGGPGDALGALGGASAGGAGGGAQPAGEDFLKTLDPKIAGLVRAAGTYQLDPAKVYSLKGNARAQFVGLVQQAYPDFDGTVYGVRSATAKAFTSGTQGQALTSNRTAIQHLGQLWTQIDALHNVGGFPLSTDVNAAKNWWSAHRGDPAVTNFNTNAQAVATEVGKALRGTGAMSEKEIGDWKQNFGTNASPEQMRGAIQTALDLLGKRNQMMDTQYQAAMGGKHMPIFIDANDAATLKGMGVDPAQFDPNYAEQPAASGQESGGGQAGALAPGNYNYVPGKGLVPSQ